MSRRSRWELKREIVLRRDSYLCRQCKRCGRRRLDKWLKNGQGIFTNHEFGKVVAKLISLGVYL